VRIVRFESSWARFRTAAADLLGWKVALAAPTLDAAIKADALGVAYVELPASPDPAIKANSAPSISERQRCVPPLRTRALRARQGPRVETLILTAAPDDLTAIDFMANQFGISVAVVTIAPGTSTSTATALASRWTWPNPNCLRPPHICIHLRPKAITPALLRELYDRNLKLILTSTRVLDAFEQAVHPVMTDRVAAIARTMPIRDPGHLTPAERSAIEAAIPTAAPAKPRRPETPGSRSQHRLDRPCRHPAGNLMLELLGKRTGAWETVFQTISIT